jgi:hypothetical protein
MMLKVTKAVHDVLIKRFHAMLNAGAFPEVEFSMAGGFKSYKLMEYSAKWATFAKVVDAVIKHDMQDGLGIFSRRRSKAFLSYLERIANEVTPAEVLDCNVRFKTWTDSL